MQLSLVRFVEVVSAAISLGWNSDSWDKFLGEPGAYGKKLSQLRDEEKSAACALCHLVQCYMAW